MNKECTLKTDIRTLGPCKLDSHLPYRTCADDKTIQIFVDEELTDGAGEAFVYALRPQARAKNSILTPRGPSAPSSPAAAFAPASTTSYGPS